jgi:hypothetical protein
LAFPINRAEADNDFSFALRRGLGRAVQYTRDNGVDGVADSLLANCLKNMAYDRQCEGSKAEWLFEMIGSSRQFDWFASSILDGLMVAEDDYDLDHLCRFASLIARRGTMRAADLLREKVLGQSFDGSLFGIEALARLDGVDSLVEIARRIGQSAKQDQRAWVSPLDAYVDDETLVRLANDRLELLSGSDSDIAKFLDVLKQDAARTSSVPKLSKEERDTQQREKARQELKLGDIFNQAGSHVGEYAGRYMRFGRFAATDAELRLVLQRFADETDEDACLRLLWVFRRAKMPEIPEKVWMAAISENGRLREAACCALAQVEDQRIGDFARNQLSLNPTSRVNVELLELFGRNFNDGDDVLILDSLPRIKLRDDDDAHAAGMAVLAIWEHNQLPSLGALLEWAYFWTPCSVCRNTIVKNMVESGICPDDMLRECLLDSEKETRQLAESKLGIQLLSV